MFIYSVLTPCVCDHYDRVTQLSSSSVKDAAGWERPVSNMWFMFFTPTPSLHWDVSEFGFFSLWSHECWKSPVRPATPEWSSEHLVLQNNQPPSYICQWMWWIFKANWKQPSFKSYNFDFACSGLRSWWSPTFSVERKFLIAAWWRPTASPWATSRNSLARKATTGKHAPLESAHRSHLQIHARMCLASRQG